MVRQSVGNPHARSMELYVEKSKLTRDRVGRGTFLCSQRLGDPARMQATGVTGKSNKQCPLKEQLQNLT